MVICGGPGNDEESSMHEKMYMIVREGPIHRCQVCGQCFKLLVLKDGNNAENEYYNSIFTDVADNVVGELELMPYMLNPWVSHDPNMNHYNILPVDRKYVLVDADEADHLYIDPAYRMQRYKEVENNYKQLMLVDEELRRQGRYISHSMVENKQLISKDIFETWYEVEKAILKFDRIFNRYEKFYGRAMFDPENHERRERRMLERESQRKIDNYTFYLNGLTEFEQNYRDYYESDVEDNKENEFEHEKKDNEILRNSKNFEFERFEFQESSVLSNDTQPVIDVLGSRLFRYKYRHISDPKYVERNSRVLKRYIERANHRESQVVNDLGDSLEKIYVQDKLHIKLSGSLIPTQIDAKDELLPYFKYVADEGFKQFTDYYETDEEEKPYFDYYNEISEREKIRFAEHFENFFNKSLELDKYYVSIPKRPFDKKKSFLSNFVEDLIDFNTRVRPISRNLAFKDASAKSQPLPITEEEISTVTQNERYRKVLGFSKTGTNYIDELKNTQK